MISVAVDAAEALRGLKALEDELRIKAVQVALRSPGRELARTMRSLAPKRTGTLQQSITARQLSKTAGARLDVFTRAKGRGSVSIDSDAVAGVLVGPNKKVKGRSRAYIGVVIEGGAGPHEIRPRGKNKRGFLSFGGKVTGEGATGAVSHPGVRANPFMQRALQATAPRIEELFYRGLAAHLDKLKR